MYRNISKIFSRGSTYLLKNMVLDDISLIGKTINVDLISSSTIDQLEKIISILKYQKVIDLFQMLP